MSRSGWEVLPDVREWTGDPPGCPEVVGKTSRMSGSGLEALPDVRECSGGTPGCLLVVGRSSWKYQSGWEPLTGGWEAFLDDRAWSGGPPGYT